MLRLVSRWTAVMPIVWFLSFYPVRAQAAFVELTLSDSVPVFGPALKVVRMYYSTSGEGHHTLTSVTISRNVTSGQREDVVFRSGEGESLLYYRRALRGMECMSEEMDFHSGVLQRRRIEPLREIDCVGHGTSIVQERTSDKADVRRAARVIEDWQADRTLFRNLMPLRIE